MLTDGFLWHHAPKVALLSPCAVAPRTCPCSLLRFANKDVALLTLCHKPLVPQLCAIEHTVLGGACARAQKRRKHWSVHWRHLDIPELSIIILPHASSTRARDLDIKLRIRCQSHPCNPPPSLQDICIGVSYRGSTQSPHPHQRNHSQFRYLCFEIRSVL